MSKSCINCKYFYAGKCNNKEVNSNIKIDVKKGYEYSEEGVLVETLREKLDIKYIIELITDELREKDLLKKKFNIYKFNIDDVTEEEIHRSIDEALYNSLSNYFDGTGESIEIKEPRDFYCNRWE